MTLCRLGNERDERKEYGVAGGGLERARGDTSPRREQLYIFIYTYIYARVRVRVRVRV